MKDELTFFDTNIKHIINGLSKLNKKDSREIQRLPALMERERNVLEKAFQHFLYANTDNEFLSRITKKYHYTLVKLSNLAYAKIPQVLMETYNKTTNPLEAIYLNIVLTIEELIQSILIESADYLNDDLIAPNYNVDLHGTFFKRQFSGIGNLLCANGVSLTIYQVLMDYFGTFDSGLFHSDQQKSIHFNYSQINYAIKLLSVIEQVTNNEQPSEWPKSIWKSMVRYDFNQDRMLQYANQYVYVSAIDGKTELERYHALSLLLKELKAMETDKRWHYESGHLSLKTYTENLLKEELDYQNKSYHKQMQDLLNKYKNVILIDTTIDEINLWTVINIELSPLLNHKPGEALEVMKQFLSIIYPEESTFHKYNDKLNDFDLATVSRYYNQLIEQSVFLAKHFPDLNKD